MAVAFAVTDPIPLGSTQHFFTFAAVFDRNGNPVDNFVALPAFPLDFFQNTDAWYELLYSPITGEWRLTRRVLIGGVARVLGTDAAATIIDNTVLFLIPRSELSLDAPALPFRVSAFVYDRTDPFGMSQGLAAGDTFPGPLEPLALMPLP